MIKVKRNIALRVSIRSVNMMNFGCAKTVTTELVVVKMSRPFMQKPSAYWVMQIIFLHGVKLLCARVSALFGPRQHTIA